MKKIIKFILLALLAFIIIIPVFFFYKGWNSNQMEDSKTLVENKLGICSEKPNCVSSFHPKGEKNYLAPKVVDLQSIESIKLPENCSITTSQPYYIHAKCQSDIFNFTDDLELYLDTQTSTLHFRSSSRVGYSDMGVNRKRVISILESLL